MATRDKFFPMSAEPPASSPALLGFDAQARPYIAYDATTEWSTVWSGIASQGLTGTLTAVVKCYMASATSGSVVLGGSIEAVTPADALDLDSTTSFDTENNSSSTSVPGTQGYLFDVSITLTNKDSIAAADYYRFKLARKTADGGDTASGNLNVLGVELRDAA